MLLASILAVPLLAGCAYFGMNWAGGDVGKTASDVQTFKRMSANQEGEHNLPWFPPPFIGRDENVSHITNMLLLDPRIRGVHITGAPAIGKSHLAVHVGYELVGHGVNIRYIDVSETQLLHEQDPKQNVQDSSNSVNENNQDSTAVARRRTNLMLSWFSPQEHNDISVSASSLVNWAKGVSTVTTIILDNCDDVLQGDLNDVFLDLIQTLQKASKYVRIISTSRVLFTLVGIKHFPLGGLEENSSTDLLQQECETFQVEEMKVVGDLVGHNPLGLRLAAKLACDVMTVNELIDSLRANSVKTLSSEPISDNQKMQFVIETSIKYLDKEIILCARNISLFPGSFSKEAGVRILSGCGVEDATYCLNSLSHKSLLEWYAVREGSRYRYHRLVRDSLIMLGKKIQMMGFRCIPPILNDSEDKRFYIRFKTYFIAHLMKTLQESGTELHKYWKHEEHNIEFVSEVIRYSSSQEIKDWCMILKDSILVSIYGEQRVSRLIHHLISLVFNELLLPGDLIETVHELIYLSTKWQMANHNIYPKSFFISSVYMHLEADSKGYHINQLVTTVHQTFCYQGSWKMYGNLTLCAIACISWCENSVYRNLTCILCYLGCDENCQYYTTDICLVALITSLLIQMVRTPLWRHGRHRTGAIVFDILAVTLSFMASTTPARYATWLVQSCISCVPAMVDSTVAMLLATLMTPLTLLLFTMVSWMFKVLSKFLLILTLLLVNYYYGDSIPLFIILLLKISFVLLWCVWTICFFLQHTCQQNIFLIVLVLFAVCGDNQLLTPCHFPTC